MDWEYDSCHVLLWSQLQAWNDKDYYDALRSMYGCALPARRHIEKQILERWWHRLELIDCRTVDCNVMVHERVWPPFCACPDILSRKEFRSFTLCQELNYWMWKRWRMCFRNPRLPPLQSSNISYEAYSGQIGQFTVESYLGLPENTPVQPVDSHTQLEQKLKLSSSRTSRGFFWDQDVGLQNIRTKRLSCA